MYRSQFLERLNLSAEETKTECQLTGITCDSREARPGYVFFARKGQDEIYTEKAVKAGAVLVLSSEQLSQSYCDDQIFSEDLNYGQACAVFFDRPAEKLKLIAVTGTNGKSTVAWMLSNLLNALGANCGFVGTFAYQWPGGREEARWTTPDSAHLQSLLRRMSDDGCCYVVMEASSHALEQGRLDGCRFESVIFTNLSHDHLDYHGDMESYYSSKKSLFENYLKESGRAIVAQEDSWGRRLLSELGNVNCDSVGFGEECDVRIKVLEKSLASSIFTLEPFSEKYILPVAGVYNVVNAACAITALLGCGFVHSDIAKVLEQFPGTPGRLQSADEEGSVLIDYAHTPDALDKVLTTLRSLTSGRLIVVFGCGGDRDRSKRAEMGKVAEASADLIILCDDNPRGESPQRILQDIASGISSECSYEIIADRRQAICRGLERKKYGDCLLIAGKGHEDYQIYGNEKMPFNDLECARRLMEGI